MKITQRISPSRRALQWTFMGAAVTCLGLSTLAAKLPATESPPVASSRSAVWRSTPEGTLSLAALRHGMRTSEVMFIGGAPDLRLPPNVWAYSNCIADDPALRQAGLDTVLLQFAEDRLVLMRLVSGQDLKALLARAAARSTLSRDPTLIADAMPRPERGSAQR